MPSIPDAAEKRRLLRAFAMEAGIYACLVVVYFLGVLRFLAGWLLELFQHHRSAYAAVALVLMIGQGMLLESVTTWLLRKLGRRRE